MAEPNQTQILQAAKALKNGELIAFATETVYGLGADATNADAVARIFSAKGRPRFNPLIIHVPDLAHASAFGRFSALATKLADHFWPGPLTLVVPLAKDCGIADLVTAGLDTIAIRVPGHPVAQKLLKEIARPLAAPSANRSGHVSPTSADHVREDFGDAITMVLDGGPTQLGLESTVVSVVGPEPKLLRPGAVTRETLEAVLRQSLATSIPIADAPRSPGQLTSHYAPRARVRLNVATLRPGEALLAFGPNVPETTGPCFNLSPSGDVGEAAINFFRALRLLDRAGTKSIAVMPIPATGLGEAINDRLTRAAAARA